MPSNKILTTIVICIGIIVSVWLIQKVPVNSTGKINAIKPVTNTNPTINSGGYDWKSTLEAIGKQDSAITDITKTNDNVFDESTLTAQIAKDFFSQYLLAKNGGVAVTSEEMQQIVNNVLSNPDYIASKGAVYMVNDLNITNSYDNQTMLKYKNAVVTSIKKAFQNLNRDPSGIVLVTIKANDPSKLSGLDPIIATNQTIIREFLSIQVPKTAVPVHLALLNALSNTLENIESMRQLFDDPLKGFAAIKFYDAYASEFINSLNAMSEFLVKIK